MSTRKLVLCECVCVWSLLAHCRTRCVDARCMAGRSATNCTQVAALFQAQAEAQPGSAPPRTGRASRTSASRTGCTMHGCHLPAHAQSPPPTYAHSCLHYTASVSNYDRSGLEKIVLATSQRSNQLGCLSHCHTMSLTGATRNSKNKLDSAASSGNYWEKRKQRGAVGYHTNVS